MGPVPQCNADLVATAPDMCTATSTIEVDCNPRPTVPPFDPNDSSRDKMENPKIPLGASINLERYYNYLAMQGKLTVYKYTDHTNEREAKKQEIIDLAIDQQFVTRFTSMVVRRCATRSSRRARTARSVSATSATRTLSCPCATCRTRRRG